MIKRCFINDQPSSLQAISPLDGRYADKSSALRPFFSEEALIRYRLVVESHWLMFLSEMGLLKLAEPEKKTLSRWISGVDSSACIEVKKLEEKTNHDVKAVEYFMREKLKTAGAQANTLAMLHFACTSEDINNLSYALMCRDGMKKCILPAIAGIQSRLLDFAKVYASTPMLSRTHGQPASPTTVGKEFAVFWCRIEKMRKGLETCRYEGKINGAVGNFNAHALAFPEMDWLKLSHSFVVKKLGLEWNPITTQIENHDSLVRLMSDIALLNVICIGLCRDVWGYISLGFFKQKQIDTEVGSSTMPHKINPIDFENAEGNFGFANAISEHFRSKLLISRWQRDLSDSTVLRNIGVFFGHSLLGFQSLVKGLDKLELNHDGVENDLKDRWEILGEAIQTILRKRGVVDAYERLKNATRGRKITQSVLAEIIHQQSELTQDDKKALLSLTPQTYLGYASRLGRECASIINLNIDLN